MQAAAEYAKRLQEAREEALESKRREVLDKLEWESNSYDLRTMPEDQFDRVVAVAKERHAELLVAKERDRLERMEAAERLRLENEELRKVAERESKLRREAEAREAEQRSKALQEAAERASVVARGERQREAEQSRLAAATDAERALAYVTALQAVAIPMIANYEVSSVVLQLAASIDAAEGVLRKLKGERLV